MQMSPKLTRALCHVFSIGWDVFGHIKGAGSTKNRPIILDWQALRSMRHKNQPGRTRGVVVHGATLRVGLPPCVRVLAKKPVKCYWAH